jgi:Flp pilus assembly protein TadG
MKLLKRSDRGQALIVIALAAIVLFGFVGLAIDGSFKFSDRRHAQNAADTAALAAALEKVNMLTAAETDSSITTTPATCASTSMAGASDVCAALVLAGLNRAGGSNGYDNITNNTVEIYSPPTSGYYSGNENYVQVIITSHVKTIFMRVLGIAQTDNVVQAVAYTKMGRTIGDGAMIISYDPHPSCNTGLGNGGNSVYVSGSSTINLTGGGIFVNSQENCGYYSPNCPNPTITGGAGINSAASVDNVTQKDTGCTNPPATENLNQEPIAIPDDVDYPSVPPECSMSGYPTPDPLGTVNDANGKPHEKWLIHPGYYTDFPQATLVANKSYIYMASGVYCIDAGGKDVSWSDVDASMLNGSTDPSENPYTAYNPNGVTLYIRNSTGFKFNDTNPTYLDATTSSSSEYKGYLIILEGNSSSIETCSISGGADIDINGMIFAPYCNITVNGGSSTTAPINAQLLGWDITIDGKAGITFNYNPAYKITIKRKIGLMK